jgi:hypothetical protein
MKLTSERGQSLLEAMLGLAVLGTLGVAVHLTGRWHDLSISALQSSASAGFMRTFGQPSGPAVRLERSQANTPPGGSVPALLKEWKIGDDGLVVARAGAVGMITQVHLPAWAPSPAIVRDTYMHGGTGHGQSDAQIQLHTGSSPTAWSAAAAHSAELVHQVSATTRPVDAPWRRPAPDSDWLTHWAGFVPVKLLRRPSQ